MNTFTPQELGDFLKGLPEDTCVVIVAQRGRRAPVAMRTGSLDPRVGNNWVKAVWEGMFGEDEPAVAPQRIVF